MLPGPAGGARRHRACPRSTARSSSRTGSALARRHAALGRPGFMVAVGYMDPGNWATDLAGGAQFGYLLLSVVLISNLMAILLQALSARLGIVTGRDLAQACRDDYSRPVAIVLWVLCEIAIVACDLAEVHRLGDRAQPAVRHPAGRRRVLTALDVLLVLLPAAPRLPLHRGAGHRADRHDRRAASSIELLLAQPEHGAPWRAASCRRPRSCRNPAMLYIAIGILGATVMPHNLYLHSSIVQTRAVSSAPTTGKREAIRYATIDSTVALLLALFINARDPDPGRGDASTAPGTPDVAEIGDAYELLTPLLGAAMASTLFAVALLASGQNSTLTGTLAGQIVMEGFLNIRMRPWLRRLITRAIAIVPAVIVAGLYGERGTGQLLVLSQVILSCSCPSRSCRWCSSRATGARWAGSSTPAGPRCRLDDRRRDRRPERLSALPDRRAADRGARAGTLADQRPDHHRQRAARDGDRDRVGERVGDRPVGGRPEQVGPVDQPQDRDEHDRQQQPVDDLHDQQEPDQRQAGHERDQRAERDQRRVEADEDRRLAEAAVEPLLEAERLRDRVGGRERETLSSASSEAPSSPTANSALA